MPYVAERHTAGQLGVTPAQRERCPKLDPKLWERICAGPERCTVELTFADGKKVEARFYDGWTPDSQYDLTQVVDAVVTGDA